jgi:hypothetical protein
MSQEVQRAGPEASPLEVAPATGCTSTHVDSMPSDGLDRAIAKAEADWWAQNALLAIKQLAMSGRGFTADHVLDMVGAPTDHHYLGAVFAIAQRQRIAEAVGATLRRDSRLLRVWLGVPA